LGADAIDWAAIESKTNDLAAIIDSLISEETFDDCSAFEFA
jgi:hypothetical protein